MRLEHVYGYIFGGNAIAPEPLIMEEHATFKDYADFEQHVIEIVAMFGLNGYERDEPGDSEIEYSVAEIKPLLPNLWGMHQRRQAERG